MRDSPLGGSDHSGRSFDHASVLTRGDRWIIYSRRIVSAVLCVLGLFLVQQGIELGYQSKTGPGPGFFPVWVGVAMAALSIAWFVVEMRTSEPPPVSDDFDIDPQGHWRVLRLLGAMVALALAFVPLGYNLSVLFFLLFLSVTMGKGNLALKVLVAFGGSFGVYLAFERGLRINLPSSALPFLQSLGL